MIVTGSLKLEVKLGSKDGGVYFAVSDGGK